MRVFQFVSVLAIGPATGLGLMLAMGASELDGGEKRLPFSPSSKVSQEVPGPKKVPLDLVYSTSAQKGLIRLPSTKYNKLDSIFEDLYRDMRGVGASNIFLAQGDDIEAAVLATWEVYVAWQTCDTPASTATSKKSNKFWLAAYLGISTTTPPVWEVKSVEMKDKTIQFKYAKGGKSTGTNRRQYHFWAPLDVMSPGSYILELFDEDAGQVALSRRVTIASPNKK